MKLGVFIGFFGCALLGAPPEIKAPAKEPVAFSSSPTPIYTYPGKTDRDLAKAFELKPWSTKKLMCFDSHYVGVNFKYFIEYTEWFNKFRAEHCPTYNNGDSFDCENFAFLYKSLMITSVFKKKNLRQILVGVLMVKSEKPFHGIGGNGLHALNIIYTSAGWYVVEPQNGQYTELEKYTNPIIRYIF